MATATSLGFSIFSRYDGTGVRRAERDIDKLQAKMSKVGMGVGGLMSSIVALGPALIPIFAAITAGIGAMGVAIVGAGAAFGVFAAAAMSQLKPVFEGYKKLTQAREALAKAHTKAQKDAALLAIQDALKGMNKDQIQAMASLDKLHNAWKSFGKDSQKDILGAFRWAIEGLINVMKTFEPVVAPMAKAVKGLAQRFAEFGKSGGMKDFANWLAGPGVAAFKSIIESMLKFGSGLASVFKSVSNATGQGKSFTDWLDRVATGFKNWAATSGGVTSFFNTVNQYIPAVLAGLGNLWQLIVNLTVALAPVGVLIMKALAPTAGLLATIADKCPWLIQGLWGIVAAGKVLAIVISAVRGAMLLLDAVMTAGPIGLVILAVAALAIALVVLYNKCKTARDIMNAAWKAIASVASWLYNTILKPIFIGIAWYVKNVVAPVMVWLWKNVVTPAWLAMRAVFTGAWVVIKAVFTAIVWYVKNALAPVISWLWKNVVVPAWNGIKSYIVNNWPAIKAIFNAIKTYIVGTLAPAFVNFYNNTIKPVWNNVKSWISNAWIAVKAIFNAIKSFIQNVLAPAWRWLYESVIKPVWNAIKDKINSAWSTVKIVFNALKSGINTVASVFNKAKDAITSVWGKIRDAARAPVKFLIDTVWNNGIVKVWNNVVAKIPGVGKVNSIPIPKGLAGGGMVPGYQASRKDDVMMPMRRGEGVLVPEVVRAMGPGWLNSMNSMGHKGVNHVRNKLGLAGGGVVNKAQSVNGLDGNNDLWFKQQGYPIKHSGHGLADGGIVGNFIKAAKGFFAGGVDKAVHALTNPLMAGLAGVGGKTGIGGLPYQAGNKLITGIDDYLLGHLSAGGGGGTAVVDAARSYLGQGDHGGNNVNNPFNQQWGFGDGTFWCANFVSSCVKKANAQKYYPGYPSASVEGYLNAMQHVPWGSAQPGDLRCSGGEHINIIEKMENGRATTIGGNEGPVVRRSQHYQSGTICRPKAGAPGGAGLLSSMGGGLGGGKVSGRTSYTWYGGPNDSQDNNHQASGIRPHTGSISSPYWPMGTKVTMGFGNKTMSGLTVEEFGPAAWAIAQHSPPAIVDLGYMTAAAAGHHDGVANFTVNSWGGGSSYRHGGPGYELAGGSRIGHSMGGIIKGYRHGGNMTPGELAIVGEAGPELFRAGGTGGTVYPHGTASGQAVNIVFKDKVYVKSEADFKKMVLTALDDAKRKGRL